MNCAACAGALPPDARFCPACGAACGRPVAVAERKLVTVVFCDLVGSTALSGSLDPETLRSVTLAYFAAMRAPIEEFGGTVEKFIGDAVMAVFGVPVMQEDDARRAAAATLAMRAALADLNADLAASLGVRLQVRIGVNTGQAVTSTDVSTRQALVSGETVNVAARLEQSAATGEILIGPLTRRALGATARVETVGPLRLKGKDAPVTAYRLLGIDDDAPERLRRFDLPFVGREAELGELDEAFDAVVGGGSSRLVTVYGEPGIGKTRLVRAWLDRVGRPVAHGAGRCRRYGEHGSLAPLAEAVRNLLAELPVEQVGTAEARAVLDAGLLRDGTPGPSLAGTRAAVAGALTALSRTRPVVMTVDDCQWASDPLLDLLDRLVGLTARAAVLFVRLARLDLLDRRPPPPGDGSRRLILSGLSAAECEVVVGTLAEVGAHLSVGSGRLAEVTGGNPLYLEQLLAADPVTAGSAGPAGGRDLPHTLQALLGARIDALDRPERTALDLAAVLGREFAAGQVRALARTGPEGRPGGPLAAGGPDPVPAALARLRRRRLVEPAGPTPTVSSHRFSNGLIYEATYRAMAKGTRAERHERAAHLLVDEPTATVTVAGHLEYAYRYRVELGLRGPATDAVRRWAAGLLTVAGSQALTRSDLAWAGALLTRAVGLHVAGEPGWSAAARQLGEILIATGRRDEGRPLLQAVVDAGSDPVEIAHARLAQAADGTPAVDAAALVACEVLAVFAAAGDELGQARARIRMAQERQFHGRHGEADDLLQAALAHVARCDAEPERALALGAVGMSLWRGPAPVPVAVLRCRDLLAAHGVARPVVRMTLSFPLAVLLALDEEWAAARACLAAARQLVDDLGYAEGTVVLPIFTAAVDALAGHPDAALDSLDRAADAAETLSAGGLLSTVTREAARLLLDQGRVAAAADRLATVGAGTDLLRADLADLDGLRARLAAARGRADEAVELAGRAVSAATATDSPIVQAVAALDRADTFHRLGRLVPAVQAVGVAVRRFRDKGHVPGLRRAARLRAQLTTGQPAPARRD
jgi:class 3 adenylate cyclase